MFSAWAYPTILRRCLPSSNSALKAVMLVTLAVNLFVAVWCCIGISPRSRIGFKQPWEFYLWQAVQGFTGALINFSFTVLFAQLSPRGREIEYFGFQTVLSCATIWIPQIVNGPIVTATNITRLPAAVCAATLLGALGLASGVTIQKASASSRKSRRIVLDRLGRSVEYPTLILRLTMVCIGQCAASSCVPN